MKLRIVQPRRGERRISFPFGPPYPSEAGWVWADRRAHLERRHQHNGIERRACQREEALFRTLFEMSPHAAAVLDGRGAVVVANRQCERLLGYRRGELVGEAVDVLLPERYRGIYLARREPYAARPSPLCLQPEVRRRDGSELPVEIHLIPVESLHRQLLLAVMLDLSEQRRTLESLQREVRELLAAKAALEADLRTLASRFRSGP